MTLHTGSQSWEYDDNSHSYIEETKLLPTDPNGNGLVDGQTFQIFNPAQIRDVVWEDGQVGGIANSQTVEIYSKDNTRNVTSNYVIAEDFGTLTITPRYVTLHTESQSWIYDDIEHSYPENTQLIAGEGVSGGLVSGQTFTVIEHAKIRDVIWNGREVCSMPNKPTFKILSADRSRNVINNYVITEEDRKSVV